MRRTLTIKLPAKNKLLVYCQFILVMIMFWLRDVLHFPSAITYVTDVILLYVLFMKFPLIRNRVKQASCRCQLKIVGLIALCMMIGAIFNFVSPMLVLWGARNNLRFFAFFFVCVGLLEEVDVDKIIKLFKVFYWLNVLMCLFQHFVLGYSNDYLGGFFGISQGCNAYINIMVCIILAITFGEYFVGKLKLIRFVPYIITALLLATLCELKVLYIEFVMIAVVTIICTKPSWKTIGICTFSLIGFLIAIQLMIRYNPNILQMFTDPDSMDYYLSGNGYTNSGDLNRFSAIQDIHDMFFDGSLFHSLFGFGLGNCEYSSFSFLQSDFYKKFSFLNYRWMTHAWVYLEQGAIGLILLIVFFVSIFAYVIYNQKKIRKEIRIAIMAFLPTCFLGIIYNCALEIEACYLIAIMCAIPFVLVKSKRKEDIRQNETIYQKTDLQRKI